MHRRLVLAALALVLLVGAACSSSSKSAKSADDGSKSLEVSTTTIKRPAQDDPTMVDYCKTWRSIVALGSVKLSDDAATQAGYIRDHYGKVLPLATTLVQQAPAEIRDRVNGVVQVIQQALSTGKMDPFHVADNADNAQEMFSYSARHCAEK